MFSFANDAQAGHTGILYFHKLLWIQNISNARASWEYRHIPNSYLRTSFTEPTRLSRAQMKPCCLFLSTCEGISVQKYLQKNSVLVSRDGRHFTWMPHLLKSSNGTTRSSLFLGQGDGLWADILSFMHTLMGVCAINPSELWTRLNNQTQQRPPSQ